MRPGPLLMVIASLVITAMFAIIKVARVELSSLDVVFWRGAVAVPLSFLVAYRTGLRLYRPGLFALRALFGFGAIMGFVYSAKGLMVADLGLIFRLQPVAVALLAPLALGRAERAGASLWVVLLISLVGVGLILAPGLAVGSTYGLAALASTLCSAGAHICLRALARTDDPRVVVFYLQMVMLLVAPFLLFAQADRLPAMPSTSLLMPVLGIGVLSTVGQLLYTYAYSLDRVAVVAAASYSGVIFAVLIDILFFMVVPGWSVWFGGALIVAAGLWLVFQKDNAQDDEQDAAASPATPATLGQD